MESSVPAAITVQWDILFDSGLVQSVGCLMEEEILCPFCAAETIGCQLQQKKC